MIWLGIQLVASSCEDSSKRLGTIKGGEFLGQLSEYYFIKKDFAPWR
jgi:hypothetical protein